LYIVQWVCFENTIEVVELNVLCVFHL